MTSQVTVDLPWPPSVNRIWRSTGRRVYRDPRYIAWAEEAGWVVKAKRLHKIEGKFSATIVLFPPDKRKIDVDNRVKVLLDLAQKSGLIEDDHLCRLLVVSYGEDDTVPPGARLTIAPM